LFYPNKAFLGWIAMANIVFIIRFQQILKA